MRSICTIPSTVSTAFSSVPTGKLLITAGSNHGPGPCSNAAADQCHIPLTPGEQHRIRRQNAARLRDEVRLELPVGAFHCGRDSSRPSGTSSMRHCEPTWVRPNCSSRAVCSSVGTYWERSEITPTNAAVRVTPSSAGLFSVSVSLP